MSDPKLIRVSIRSTEDVLFDGDVDRITSYNEIGKFDVYPMHANFISIIEKQITLFLKRQIVKEMKLERAVMKVKQDKVNIYMGIEALLIGDETTATEAKDTAQQPAPNK